MDQQHTEEDTPRAPDGVEVAQAIVHIPVFNIQLEEMLVEWFLVRLLFYDLQSSEFKN